MSPVGNANPATWTAVVRVARRAFSNTACHAA